MRTPWSLFLLLCASLLLPMGCNRDRNESIRLMNKGIQLMQRRKPHEATDHLVQATKIDPTNDRAWFYLGMIEYQKMGRLPEGEKSIRQAIKLNDNDYEYHYHLGQILERREDPSSAINAFEKAIKLNKDHAESHLRLGTLLEADGQVDRAQEEYHQAILLDPHLPHAYHALGSLYLRYEKYPHAAQVLKNAVENNPAFAANYRTLGLVYQAQKRYDDAIMKFEKALVLDPRHIGTLFNLGMTYAANDNPQKAIDRLNLYIQRGGDEDVLRLQTAQETIDRLETAAQKAEP